MPQRDLTYMLLARHELQTLRSSAESVIRIARELDDDEQLVRGYAVREAVEEELRCRALEADAAPF